MSKTLAEKLGIDSPSALYSWIDKNLKYDGSLRPNTRTVEQLLEEKKGHCWEIAEFERVILHALHLSPTVLFLENAGCRHTHATVLFEDEGKTYSFEWAWGKHAGIHVYASRQEAVDTFRNQFIREYRSLSVYTETKTCTISEGCTPDRYIDAMQRHAPVDGVRRFDGYSVLPTTPENIEFFKSIYPELRHVRTGKEYVGDLVIDLVEMSVVAVLQCNTFGWIIALEVAPAYRQQNYASSLLQTAVRHYRATRLSVNKSNIAAIALYKKRGWVVEREDNAMLYMAYPAEAAKDAPIFARW